jgi:hypothetical protein
MPGRDTRIEQQFELELKNAKTVTDARKIYEKYRSYYEGLASGPEGERLEKLALEEWDKHNAKNTNAA